ncbi:MAG: efflux RND transporter periplasmic adaptor subunit [Bacteroidales bacterium]|nr:efflux RND transporter periplasmic adaptor subunit [Bacteroidales bacterium]MBN2755566.1 efflux RND transporter periplasmic adaptor subunit [Bacteroidales bacterium]
MKSNIFIIIFILSVVFFSCKNKMDETEMVDTELIEITKAQFESENMEFGEPVLSQFSDLLHFTGTIAPSAYGLAQISLPFSGLVSKIYFKPGQIVNKGTIMFEVSGNEFIDMQKDFAESAAIINRLKTDYERAKELKNENIGTTKDYILAESAYNAEKAKFSALKLKLENIGLDVSKIERGEFYSSFFQKSPINGYVANIFVNIGQYIEPQQNIAEVIDIQSFQLIVSVFEKEISKVKIGQNVEFYSTGNKAEKYLAKISSVGKIISNTTKSIECFAEITNSKSNFVSNQFVEGEICIAVDSVLSVPETAVLKSENDKYILIFEKETPENFYFKKINVKIGRKSNNLVELIDKIQYNKILTKGIYNIQIE